MKISKVRRTDYRSTATNTTGSQPTGLERLASSQAHEAAMHDAAVKHYPPHLIDSAATDLDRRGNLANQRDHETRWIMARKAALRRRAGQLSTPATR